MILDKELMFSEDQAVTASAASTNHIDLGEGGGDQSLGEPILLHCQVTEDFSTATGSTLVVSVQESAATSFGSPTTIATSETASTTDLKAGYTFKLGHMPSHDARYVRLYYTAATSFSAGKLTAGLILSKQTNL